MPLPVFDFIFRPKFCRLLFNFYGRQVFCSAYHSRQNNDSFWLSRESLYWHFWRQSDQNDQLLAEILPAVSLQGATVVELGFGLGRNYRQLSPGVGQYIAVEPNQYICDYVAEKFAPDKNFKIICQSTKEFIASDQKFDVLIASNGILMYISKKIVDEFFSSLSKAGVKTAIFLNEGSAGEDVVRDDDTTMYDFKSRLIKAGYGDKKFLQKVRETGIYDYLVMH